MSSTLRDLHWSDALSAARMGDLEPARAAYAACPEGPVPDYLFGRALAETGEELDLAVELMRRSLERDPGNPLAPHALALALARRGDEGDAQRAAALWEKSHLPHDLDLLGQTALTLEAQLHPITVPADFVELAWPEWLERPEALPAKSTPEGEPAEVSTTDTAELPAENQRDKMTPAAATKPPKSAGWFARREQSRELAEMEEFLDRREPWRALQLAEARLASGAVSAELHLIAGVACEDAGAWERGRAHLGRALALEPTMLHARLMLGRIYWRLNWLDLALALWRSLPVEGPYDTYRHYHLALGHAAAGDRAAANLAMRVALTEFFFDTRHAFIQRAWERWRHGVQAIRPAA